MLPDVESSEPRNFDLNAPGDVTLVAHCSDDALQEMDQPDWERAA